MNRDMLSRRLERKGFTVLLAIDGAQGVQMAASDRPDLILMDMSLPVLDGWEAGCDDYDTKPIELPRLLGKIEALLGAAPT